MPIDRDSTTDRLGGPVTAALVALAILGIVVYAAWLALGEPETGYAMDWVYDGSLAACALACLSIARRGVEPRSAWFAFALGLGVWALADVYWSQELQTRDVIPYPSPADAGYLLAIPCLFAGVGLLLRRRLGSLTIASWFDAAIAALGVASVGTAVLAPALRGLTDGDPATIVTNLAYPIADLLLLGLICGAFAVTGAKQARSIILVGCGIAVWAIADSLYLYQEATDGYVSGWWDLLWPVGALSMVAGGLVSPGRRGLRAAPYRSPLFPPAAALFGVTVVLVLDHFDRLPDVSVILAGATVLAALARLGVSFRENDHLVDALGREAVTDFLTGLGDRRALMQDLDAALAGSSPWILAIYDLDGFKAYNDSFGHPSGDVLLTRVGTQLKNAIGSRGSVYRLGGDEFCILVRDPGDADAVVEAGRVALTETGPAFRLGASAGWVRLPSEAVTPAVALHLADERLYTEKNERSARRSRQAHELLMTIVREREPALGEHVDGVSADAVEVGRRLGMDQVSLDRLARAAQLHDVGKLAIPDSILSKPTELTPDEWVLMRRHTIIGERILETTQETSPIGRLVRSSHERWDGQGYPDGLRGEEIPVESRIVFIADAFDAMVSDRPYRKATTVAAALEELRRHAGTQFDPVLVEHFCAVIEDSLVTGAGPVQAEVGI